MEKIDRTLHREVTMALAEYGPVDLGTLSQLLNYSRDVIQKHIRENMDVKEEKEQRKGTGRRATLYSLKYTGSAKSKQKHRDIQE